MLLLPDRYRHLAPLILRLALGAVFIAHGLPKLTSPEKIVGLLGKLGFPAPGFLALVVGVVEAFGGLMLVVGYGTRIVAALLAFIMLVAILTAKRSAGFVGGWEFDLVLLAAALSLVFSGPGGERTTD